MKPSEIEVGKTYRNRGKGTTFRTVLEISRDFRAPWRSNGEPVVRYRQGDAEECIYLRSFASWAGSEVTSHSEWLKHEIAALRKRLKSGL